ncbi:hypothetical protein BGZ51_005766 [Haplosporangium sp. Z 767]|nr:hypothetical protein BGZ51_005766 [Haplosporangium sp. Z 767]
MRESAEKSEKGKKNQRDLDGDTPMEEPSDAMELKRSKRMVPPGVTESISDIESRLPPLCGEDTSFTNYAKEVKNVKETLDGFYNADLSVERHQWDVRKTLDSEFAIITNRLLHMVGGAAGKQREEANKAVIGIVLDSPLQRQSFLRLPIVPRQEIVGVNEYYTSKKFTSRIFDDVVT